MSVWVDEFAEAPDVDNPDAATPGEPSADDEPTPFAEKTKNWYERHKPKIYVALGATLGLGLVVAARRHEGQSGERFDAEDIDDIENWQPDSNPKAVGASRQSAPNPDSDPFLRNLPINQHASEAAKERHRERTGLDLPPGKTSVRRWLYRSLNDEDSEENAA
jgi:hypothetical protein